MSGSKSEWVVTTTDATFLHDVVERSRVLPVVVDFWAEWCQPCRMLTPILEQLAEENQGRFLLVKANTEEAPAAAGQFGVQSIPTVYGLRDGDVVDVFAGALPETQIREWLRRILPSEAEELVAQARSMINDDVEAAEELLRRAVQLEGNDSSAKLELMQLLQQQGRIDECQSLLEQLEQRGFLEPEAERIRAAIGLQRHGQDLGGVDACRKSLAESPHDNELRLKLAESLAAAQVYEEALENSLQVIQQDPAELRERARQLMVDVFRLLPDDSELTREYRRRLSMALY